MNSRKLLVLFLSLICFSSFAQSGGTYGKTLHKYMEVSGTLDAFKTAITSMMGNFKKMNDNIPAEFWDEMESEMLKTSLDDLVTRLEPVYQKHLTEADLKEIIEFYGSPTGKKLAEKTPLLTNESMMAGQEWGQQIAQKVMTKMKEKGY